MLLSCNSRCKKSDGMTEASLDIEANKVICRKCDEELVNVSEYTKSSMRRNKDVFMKTKSKAFMFNCSNCNKKVETVVVNGVPYGKGCETKNCTIQISEMMVHAIEKIKPMELEESQEQAENDEWHRRITKINWYLSW